MNRPVKPYHHRSYRDYDYFPVHDGETLGDFLDGWETPPRNATFYSEDGESGFRLLKPHILENEQQLDAKYLKDLLEYDKWLASPAALEYAETERLKKIAELKEQLEKLQGLG